VHESEVKGILAKARQNVGARRDSSSHRWKNFETIWESLSSHFWDGETREGRLLRKEASSNSDTRDNVITSLAYPRLGGGVAEVIPTVIRVRTLGRRGGRGG
jgi:hypothetical protein